MESAHKIVTTSRTLKRKLKEVAPLTPSQEKLLDAATAIRLEPSAVERAYMARQLVQCTLPHADPGDVARWLRRNGNSALVLQAGWDTKRDCSFGYPYGSLPRLLLFWITTEAVQNKKRRLELGHSLSGFMREVGLDPNTGGGKRSDAKRLREQMERLFRCRISFDQADTAAGGAEEGTSWLDMQIAPKGELWWNPRQPEQGTLWGSWIELGEEFFQAITGAPVPMDMRALRALKRSPLALDLYAWATYRVFVVNRRGAAFIPWSLLKLQMGEEYGRTDNFVEKAKAAFRKIRGVYPGLKLKYAKGGLWLYPSPTAIAALA